jgi:hypothetical protein
MSVLSDPNLTESLGLDEVARRMLPYPHTGTPILRRRSQVEKTLALLAEALALVQQSEFWDVMDPDCQTTGRISEVQGGVVDALQDAIERLGGILHQRGPFIVVGFVQSDLDETFQREENSLLVTTVPGRGKYLPCGHERAAYSYEEGAVCSKCEQDGLALIGEPAPADDDPAGGSGTV